MCRAPFDLAHKTLRLVQQMASTLARSVGLARSLSRPCTSHVLKRSLSVSSPVMARRTKTVLEENISEDDLFVLLSEPGLVQDSPSLGHHLLMEKRMILHYLRLIEHEMPKLVGESAHTFLGR